jgi:transcriptional regulator with XRE-family HTH domain
MKERNILGHRIRLQREVRGLSKSEFSRQVGVTPTAVHNWEENGVVPRVDMLGEIARVLRVSVETLTSKTDVSEVVVQTDDGGSPAPVSLAAIRAKLAAMYNVEEHQVSISISL